MKTHTSQKLSKLLAENGCELESDWCHAKRPVGEWQILHVLELVGTFEVCVPAYDTLNDLCVKYAKELFGEAEGLDTVSNIVVPYWVVATRYVFFLLQQGDQEKAEEYLWEHCLFNPKNK